MTCQPHYPDREKDHTIRLMRLAGYLQAAKELGINPFMVMNKDHIEAVRRHIGRDEMELDAIKI